ncbi:MAG: hypothetical protein AAGK00_16275 [Pseudomonadota bacterium]
MGDWSDTVLNVQVFAFIGLLIWLMVKPVDPIEPEDQGDRSGSQSAEVSRDSD